MVDFFVSPIQADDALTNVPVDVKGAVRLSQDEIKSYIRMLADPTAALIIDGVKFEGEDKFNAAATLLLTNKLEQLTNQSSSMISVLSELYKLEKSIGQT